MLPNPELLKLLVLGQTSFYRAEDHFKLGLFPSKFQSNQEIDAFLDKMPFKVEQKFLSYTLLGRCFPHEERIEINPRYKMIENSWYRTMFHELTHATLRYLDRFYGPWEEKFKREEEAIAELGSYLLCEYFDINNTIIKATMGRYILDQKLDGETLNLAFEDAKIAVAELINLTYNINVA